MGADMLISIVMIDDGKKPDFRKGRKYIDELARKPSDKWPLEIRDRYADGSELVVDLRGSLGNLILAWKGDHRQAADMKVGGKEILITGGLSWGDSPTELFGDIEKLRDAHVTVVCGFDF